MELYILRHGEAEPRAAGIPDSGRKLIEKGKRDVRAVIKAALKAKLRPELILTSPLTRAQETAALAAALCHCERVVETRSLLPGARPDLAWKEICAVRNVQQVLLAGHEPHLGHLIAFLLEAAVVVDLKKGALVRIGTPAKTGPPRGVLKWMITPRLARGA
jgi:phosphohistidine phosphatase